MSRSIAILLAALSAGGAARVSAQEAAGPGRAEVTSIPGGAPFFWNGVK